ncbi:c-type cytochrome [Oceanospirillum maris]|jgi:cytochrome c553|uniref:c-type cytochrome n=1 Tax=Oceanospirillum maris TaxID=64977 RepID=UPI0003FC1419|nr:cytochrome c [Oceanospirillum maris]
MKKLLAVAGIVMMTASGATMAAGDAAAGKTKAAVCAACHGANGISMIPMYPNLAGQKAQYIENAIKAYKAGQRGGPTAMLMNPQAAALSDQDIADLAAYFSSL